MAQLLLFFIRRFTNPRQGKKVDQMDPTPTESLLSGVTTAISGAIDSVVSLITSNLPTVLGVAGAIMAIGIVWGIARSFLKKR